MCIVVLSLSNASILSAQETESNDDNMLGVVVVTDTGKKAKVLNTNASITVLTAEDIKNSGHRTMNALLSSIPGISDVSNGMGQVMRLSVRGTKPDSSAGPAVYVDGIPLNLGKGYSLYQTIPVETIERIEVVKSPSPAVYGRNAARGVILITTKNGSKMKKDFGASASLEYGSWKTYGGTASVLGKLGEMDYSLMGTGRKTDGWSHTNNDDRSMNLALGYNFDGGRAQFNSSYLYKTRYVRRNLTRDYAKKHPRARFQPGGSDINGNWSKDIVFTSGLDVRYNKNDWLGNFAANYIWAKEYYEYRKVLKTSADYYELDRPNHDYMAKLNGGKTLRLLAGDLVNTITMGADYRFHDYVEDKTYPNKPEDNKEKDFDSQRTAIGASMNDDASYGIFSLSGGLRWNYVKYDVDYPKERNKDKYKKTYKNNFDWSISPSVAIIENSNLFFSYNSSNSYRSGFPTDNATRDEFPRLEDLKPEKYKTIETGFKHQLNDMLNYSLVLYRTKVEGKIVTYYVPKPGSPGEYESKGKYNAGDTVSEGIEIEVNGRLMSMVGYRVGMTTMKAEWERGKKNYDGVWHDLKGQQLERIPRFQYRLGIDVHPLQNKEYGDLTIALDLSGFSKCYDDNYNNKTEEVKGGYFVNARVDYSYQNIGAFVTCTNLFDKFWFRGTETSKSNTHEGRYLGMGVTAKI